MSGSEMTISTFKRVAPLLPARVAILLRADHGVGKSSVVRQVAGIHRHNLLRRKIIQDLATGFPVLDKRISQMAEGDMVGLPFEDGDATRFKPPEWYIKACREPCCLFLDELNRGAAEVIQSAFQIVLDYELNGWKLHPETRVFSAINMGASYVVNEIDPALLDRFWCVDLELTVEDWCAWARDPDPEQGGNLHPLLPDFIENTKTVEGSSWLFPAKKVSMSSVQPSPRSWERVNETLVGSGLMDSPEDKTFYHACLGFVGNEAATAFRDFCVSADGRIKGEEIVNRYQEHNLRTRIKKLSQTKQNSIIERVAEYVVSNVTELNDIQGKNVALFMADLIDDELRLVLWQRLTSGGKGKLALATSVQKYCAQVILDVFGVPAGSTGVGVVPNLPKTFLPVPKTSKHA